MNRAFTHYPTTFSYEVGGGREREIENSKKYWHSSLKGTEDDISTTG